MLAEGVYVTNPSNLTYYFGWDYHALQTIFPNVLEYSINF